MHEKQHACTRKNECAKKEGGHQKSQKGNAQGIKRETAQKGERRDAGGKREMD